jgi:hypothetical protein
VVPISTSLSSAQSERIATGPSKIASEASHPINTIYYSTSKRPNPSIIKAS